jgi:hypothetical protein
MTGAEERMAPCGEESRPTEAEIAQGMVECEAWVRRTQRYLDREVFAIRWNGSREIDPDRAIELLEP